MILDKLAGTLGQANVRSDIVKLRCFARVLGVTNAYQSAAMSASHVRRIASRFSKLSATFRRLLGAVQRAQ